MRAPTHPATLPNLIIIHKYLKSLKYLVISS